MPRYDSQDHHTSARITSVKLDGRELLGTEDGFIKACDTDEGWVEVYETEPGSNPRVRRVKCGEWYPDPEKPGAVKRDMLTRRLTGKVEVSLKPEVGA